MQPEGDTDAVLQRYLKARKGCVALAFLQLSETIAWRKEHDVDNYLSRKLDAKKEASIRRNMHTGHLGTDREGRMVYVERSAELNLAAMTVDGVTAADVIFTQVRHMEYLVRVKMAAGQKAAGRPLDGHIVIADFVGMGLSMMTTRNLALFQELSHIYSAHYPEFMVKCLVVHPPMIISTIWRILQIFMEEGTRSKVVFVKSDYVLLHRIVDPAILPQEMGGTRPGNHPYLTSSAGFVPEEYRAMDEEIARRAAANSVCDKKAGGVTLSGIPIVSSSVSCTAAA